MKPNWERWALNFWSMLAQHISVAGMTWLGLGLKDGRIDWNGLWIAMVMGAAFPALFKFLGSKPLPDEEEDPNK